MPTDNQKCSNGYQTSVYAVTAKRTEIININIQVTYRSHSGFRIFIFKFLVE